MSQPGIIVVAVAYLLLLFAIAWVVEHSSGRISRLTGSSLVYTLSLAVYCSSWTFNGGVGKASQTGLDFLPIYLGPTLAFCLGPFLIRRILRISRANRITSIADLIGARFGKRASLAALVTVIAVVGLVPYIALQLKSISSGLLALSADAAAAGPPAPMLADGALWAAIVLTIFAMLFGSRSIRPGEHHPGMVVAVAAESILKLLSLTAIGLFVVYGLFGGFGDLFALAGQVPEIRSIFDVSPSRYGYSWIAMTLLAALAVLCLPRQFQVMVVENVDERHLNRALWLFPLYLLLINLFVLPIAFGGLLLFGPGQENPETFILSLPLSEGASALALLAYIGGFSAVTGMLIVETVAVSTMVCNDFVMPSLLRLGRFGHREGGDLTRLLLNIRRTAIVAVLMLGYLYFRVAGEAYALVSIGLISFAAVAQFAPALLGGIYWRGGTRAGAFGGLLAGFAVWAWTLMLPSVAKSGWIPAGFIDDGPFGIALLAPERLFGLTGLDTLTHSLFWSLFFNVGLYVGLSLARAPSAREASQALLFVDVFRRGGTEPVFWRGRARLDDLRTLAGRFLGTARASALFDEHAREIGVPVPDLVADARLVDRVERQIAGAVGTASARVMVESVAQEEPLSVDDVLEILDEASQLRGYARALEEATGELRAANEQLKSLDHLKDDFMSSVTHELRTPLTSIRALSELMLDDPEMDADQRQEFLGIIVAESERLTRLVNQVLDLAKIESGHAEWHNADVDLRALVTEAVRATSELFRDGDVSVSLDLPDAVPLLRADPDRLTQVMLNLLSNAAKFVPRAGGKVAVTLRHECSPEGESLAVSVRDNGPGVPLAEQATVFEKFRQGGDALTRPPGTGLGLPISRQIVDHFGGTMWLESEPGNGACFAFRLPLRPDRTAGGDDHGHESADR
jgi:Na+/proline symporter/nitrogen-specific signal transduction histidine kinase